MRLGTMDAGTYKKDGVSVEYGSCAGVDEAGNRVSMAFFNESFQQRKAKLVPDTTVFLRVVLSCVG